MLALICAKHLILRTVLKNGKNNITDEIRGSKINALKDKIFITTPPLSYKQLLDTIQHNKQQN